MGGGRAGTGSPVGGWTGGGAHVRGWLLAGWAAAVVGVLLLNVLWPLPAMEDAWMWPTGLMAFPVAGALVLTRRPGNLIGRILAVVGFAAGLIFALYWFAVSYPTSRASRPAEALSGAAVVVQFWGLLALLHLFPSGRPLGRVHARVVRGFTWAIAVMGILALGTDPLPSSGRSNPLAVAPALTEPVFDAGVLVLPVFAVVGVWVLIRRWGAADSVERAQLKWFFAGASLVLVLVAVISFVPETTHPRTWEGLLVVAGFWGLPGAILVAVTRYRLYEIDRVVSRTVSYVLLTALLIALYAGTVFVLQQLLRPVTGESQFAVAGGTLLVAALFQPVRRRVQTAVDRRFNRARYDAQRTVEAFRARLRDEVDLDGLVAALASSTNETVQPASVAVWLRPTGSHRWP